MPFPKLAEDDLQEIARVRVPPHFHVGVNVILRRDAASVIALPMNNAPMSIIGIDVVTVTGLHRRHAAAPSLQQSS
jgi:hypothetical protein